jgi:hypothetical protein
VAGLAEMEGLSIDRVRSVPFRVAFALGGLLEAARNSAPTRAIRP